MVAKDTVGFRQSARRKTALIAGRFFGPDATPRETANGVPAVVAFLGLRRVWVLTAAALAVLLWRAGRHRHRG